MSKTIKDVEDEIEIIRKTIFGNGSPGIKERIVSLQWQVKGLYIFCTIITGLLTRLLFLVQKGG